MKTIWKFELKPGQCRMMLPEGAEPLSAGLDPGGDGICLWALVDPRASLCEARVIVAGTGLRFAPGENPRFLGTVVAGQYVWHVFVG